MPSLVATYVLPLRWNEDGDLDELTSYLSWLATVVDEVIVVDGSPDPLFDKHRRLWENRLTHLRPDGGLGFLNGKVTAVTTGVRRATHETVIISDDDVRYDTDALARVVAGLDRHELVRPQNYFDPLVWHAVWDSARSLLNRAVGADFPGTLGIRKSMFERTDGYDGDVLFENLELMRTVRAAGGREHAPRDLFVRRVPPDTGHFIGQRVRQAYDDFALPARMLLWLVLGPVALLALGRSAFRSLGTGVGAAVVVAEFGRRRGDGSRYLPVAAALCAPGWLLERSVCAWIAVGERLCRGGISYRGVVIRRSANSMRQLKRRFG